MGYETLIEVRQTEKYAACDVVILLARGDKGSQQSDINLARQLARHF